MKLQAPRFFGSSWTQKPGGRCGIFRRCRELFFGERIRLLDPNNRHAGEVGLFAGGGEGEIDFSAAKQNALHIRGGQILWIVDDILELAVADSSSMVLIGALSMALGIMRIRGLRNLRFCWRRRAWK